MLLSSEIVIKPEPSPSFIRLLFILNGLTIWLVCFCSLFWWVKGIIIAGILFQLRLNYKSKTPCALVAEIRSCPEGWILLHPNGNPHRYEQASILIHNPVFQLVKFSNNRTYRFIVLFNDQLSGDLLSLFHVKTRFNKIQH